jgi:NAD(P)-dependent dehydrogenase (short-subunit alcohol dehydrogenase family)
MQISLNGTRVLVTGGGAGIGWKTAEAFMASGARVHICDLSKDNLAKFSAAFPQAGATLTDVADHQAVDRLFDEIKAKMGGLDVLVNNAGLSGPIGPVENVDPVAWQSVFAANINGTFYCTRRAIPMMREAGGGSIINISSAAGHLPYGWRSPYSSSKWAVVGFTKTVAVEVGIDKIRVNALMPGVVAGERRDRNARIRAEQAGKSVEEMEAVRLGRVAMEKAVDEEEIADLAVFLASNQARSITGQTIGIDGYVLSLTGPENRPPR